MNNETAGWVYFANDGPQFLIGSHANGLLPIDADKQRLLPLALSPSWPGQSAFAHVYMGQGFIGFISQGSEHIDESFRCEPVYLVLPVDPADEPYEIEYQSWLVTLKEQQS
jgi:hypothetical protein